MKLRTVTLVAAALVIAAITPLRARAADSPWTPFAQEPAPPDTLQRFLRDLADSTDQYFGPSGAAIDTTGLDSLLAYAIQNPPQQSLRRRLRLSIFPDFWFNRVDGPVYGGGLSIGRPTEWGEVRSGAAYAAGPNEWLGGSRFTKVIGGRNAFWALTGSWEKLTVNVDRERFNSRLATLRALVFGRDHRNYLRREGWLAGVRRESETWRFGLEYRDMLESPLVTTTSWNFANHPLDTFDNLQSTPGRVHEIQAEAAWRLPRTPLTFEAIHLYSDEAIGSELDYQRIRVAGSGDFGIGSILSVLPQFVYGKLTGDYVPQSSFYLGGSKSIRTMHGGTRGGDGLALARLDIIGIPDILAAMHIPHPAALPIQIGAFGSIGASWGKDPVNNVVRGGQNWPDPEHWVSEAGVSLIYQPGIPEPTALIRINYGVALGPAREETKLTISYSRAMDVLRPFAQ